MTEVRRREPGDGESARLGTDVFISYAREDRRFVGRLHDALAAAGQEAWVDWEGIPASAKWMAEVRAAIDAAEAFCFVISPDSVESPVCREEAAHAAASNKRIVPLLHREVAEGLVPETVAAHNWIDFISDEQFDEAFDVLAKAIASDPEWTRAHTRLLLRAKEWDQAGRDRARLLRGSDLTDAEGWFAAAEGKDPGPSALQSAYVGASRRAASRRHRAGIAAVAGVLVLSLVLSSVALVQRNEATAQRDAAKSAQALAERRTAESRSRELAIASGTQLQGDAELGLLLAIEAATASRTPEAEAALRQALITSNLRARLIHEGAGFASGAIDTAGFSLDGTRSLTQRLKDGLRLWDTSSGKTVAVVDAAYRAFAFSKDGNQALFIGAGGQLDAVDVRTGAHTPVQEPRNVWYSDSWLSPTGTRALVVKEVRFRPAASGTGETAIAREARFRLLDAATGMNVTAIRVRGYWNEAAFSPDGRYFFISSFYFVGVASRSRVRLFDARTGEQIATLEDPAGVATEAATFSPAGNLLAVTSGTRVRLLRRPTWTEVAATGTQADDISAVSFSSDGSILASGALSTDGAVRLWDTRTGRSLAALGGIEGVDVNDLAFSPDGGLVAAAGSDRAAYVWEVNSGQLVESLAGHGDGVSRVVFSSDSRRLITTAFDGVARVWELPDVTPLSFGTPPRPPPTLVTPDDRYVLSLGRGVPKVIEVASERIVAHLEGHSGPVLEAVVGPDGGVAATAGKDGTARLWSLPDGRELSVLAGHRGAVEHLAFSPDGHFLLTTGSDSTARLWDTSEGNRALVIDGVQAHGHLIPAEFSPTGDLLAVETIENRLSIRQLPGGQEITALRERLRGEEGVLWSPRGDYVSGKRTWNVLTGEPLASLGRRESVVDFTSQRPTALVLKDSYPKSTISLVDLTDSVRRWTTTVDGSVDEAHFGPRSTVMTVEGDGARIRVFDADDGAAIATLSGVGPYPSFRGFSPDGRFLVTDSNDQVLRIWDTATWRVIRTLALPNDISYRRNTTWSPDGSLLIVTDRGRGTLYPCEVCGSFDEIFELARSRVTRELTPEERTTYLGR